MIGNVEFLAPGGITEVPHSILYSIHQRLSSVNKKEQLFLKKINFFYLAKLATEELRFAFLDRVMQLLYPLVLTRYLNIQIIRYSSENI